MKKKKRTPRKWICTVEPFGKLFRVMVESFGMKGPAGNRLIKGHGKTRLMFDGVFVATNRDEAQRSADNLQRYLEDLEDKK